jgi:hypothetical protein
VVGERVKKKDSLVEAVEASMMPLFAWASDSHSWTYPVLTGFKFPSEFIFAAAVSLS